MVNPFNENDFEISVSCDMSYPLELTNSKIEAPCIFPFIYNQREYKNCTKVDYDKLWCATSVNKNGHWKTWGYCNEFCQTDDTMNKSANLTDKSKSESKNMTLTGKNEICYGVFKTPCTFPFTWVGTKYNFCKKEGKNAFWCVTEKSVITPSITRDFGTCSESCPTKDNPTEDIDRQCMGITKLPCKFPFIYKDKKYHSCTNEDSNDGFWCATSVDENGEYQDNEWLYCDNLCKRENFTGKSDRNVTGRSPQDRQHKSKRIKTESEDMTDNLVGEEKGQKIVLGVVIGTSVTITSIVILGIVYICQRGKQNAIEKGQYESTILKL